MEGRWIPAGETVRIHGYTILCGMLYLGSRLPAGAGSHGNEPELIDPRLPVDHANSARTGDGMTYWPSYASIPPQCRAAYLEWLSNGRRDPAAFIGYVFLFFYGLERRALIERRDLPEIRAEVQRLLSLYKANGSFRGYASAFLALASLGELESRDESFVREHFLWNAEESATNLAALLAWYHLKRLGLPPDVAATVASCMEDAKRSVVATRSRTELFDLFAVRYRERFPNGLVPLAAVRPLEVGYRPASSGLIGRADSLGTRIPHVLGKKAQFKPLVDIWNECVEDLKRFATALKKTEGSSGAQELTPELWAALPPELRASYDHPDQDHWDTAVPAATRCGDGSLLSVRELARLARLPELERYTAAQLRRIAETATHVGYAIEPDPRVTPVAGAADTQLVVWRSSTPGAPDEHVWPAASAVMRLAMQVAMADGGANEREIEKVTEMMETLFGLDEPLRERLRALRSLLLVSPSRTTSLTKKLVETQKPEQLEAIGRLLVAVSAADGVLTSPEHKELKTLYKNLGLRPAALDAALTAFGLRLDIDETVVVAEGRAPRQGSAVTPPPATKTSSRLDPRAIEEILKDTREVANLLATVFESSDDEEPASTSKPPPARAAQVPGAASPTPSTAPSLASLPAGFAEDLEPQYRALLATALTRTAWSEAEVRDLAAKHRVMPSAAVEAINSWSDAALGDYLIVDEGSWVIRKELVGSNTP